MAITTTTISLASGYGRTDVIQQLEQGFAYLQWHQATASGIVTGITTYSGGGDVGSASTTYYDCRQTSTTGIGTGASFYIDRASDGTIPGYVLVNRPGMGYTAGEVVTIPASEIGGTANGASNLTITVGIATDGSGDAVGFGSTGAFFKKDISDSATYPWAVARVGIDTSKEYGTTFYGFQMDNDTNMIYKVGSSFYPNDADSYSTTKDRMGGYGNRFAGNYLLDLGHPPVVTNAQYDGTSATNNDDYVIGSETSGHAVCSSNSYQLDLNIFRSSIDTNFAVMAYRHPDKSANYITDKQYHTYILHHFTNNIWDLDYVYLGGRTDIIPGATSEPELTFRTYGTGDISISNYYPNRRVAEYGYYPTDSSNRGLPYKDSIYKAVSADEYGTSEEIGIYYRNNSNAANLMNRGRGGDLDNSEYPDTVADAANYGAVIKGIPLNTKLIPCPYYIPDDFALVQFDYASPDALIQMWDTVTVSGSEVYTVITASYNQTNRTRGVAFCARTT
jgi:hypothetical protein